MAETLIFNVSEGEFARRRSVDFKDFDMNTPIGEEPALVACLSGSQNLQKEDEAWIRKIFIAEGKEG